MNKHDIEFAQKIIIYRILGGKKTQ